jgi:hypothetical protein
MANLGLSTKLHKIKGHTNIRGSDLANKAAKLVFTSFHDIPEHQKLTVTIGKLAERPPFLVMYANNPSLLQSRCQPLHTQQHYTPWWTIPEEERRCMHAFTKTSNQLCL